MALIFEKMFENFIHAKCNLCRPQGGSMFAVALGALFYGTDSAKNQTEGPFIPTGRKDSLKEKKLK